MSSVSSSQRVVALSESTSEMANQQRFYIAYKEDSLYRDYRSVYTDRTRDGNYVGFATGFFSTSNTIILTKSAIYC